MSIDTLSRGRVRVGVLRGGPSNEYAVSLDTGAHVLNHMPGKYIPLDILVSKEGDWHVGGFTRRPEQVLRHVDVIFNALHGKYGEDGKVQSLLEMHKIPFTGSGSLASSIGMHKGLSKKMYEKFGIKTPAHIVINHKNHTNKYIVEVFRSFPQPSIVKPITGGSSLGVTLARDFFSFQKAIENAFRHSHGVIIEEYISGREATCGVLESRNGTNTFALLPVEIVKHEHKDFFDYESKYDAPVQEFCPSTFDESTKTKLQHLAIDAHHALGLTHYSRSDFIVNTDRGIYILETNSLPGLTPNSLYPKALSASGVTAPEFLDHVLELALTRNGRA
jgi:D-alanine-D-alanine ligase